MKEITAAQQQLFAGRSWRAKYADLVIGRSDWMSLLHYEATLALSQWVPGAPGLALRRLLYPSLLGSCGRNVVFGQNVVLRHPHKIHIDDNVVIDDNCLIDAKGHDNTGVWIGQGVFIGRNTILSCKNGDIVLGSNVNVGFNCEVFSGSCVKIGADTMLAAYCYVIGGDHATSHPAAPVGEQLRTSRGVTIGPGGWLGAGAKVLDGITIGARAIIGAGAVVRRDVPDGAVAVGVPARILDRHSRDGAVANPGSSTAEDVRPDCT
jgi:acetyltransferase-like isoleucine patch superfamily enzyme